MRILVLEDEVFIALHMEQELRADGHEVLGPATTLADADVLLEGGAIDFALLDANIHGRAPTDLAQKLLDRSIPFAYVSGYDESFIRAHLPSAAILPKPLQMEQLRRLLRERPDEEGEATPNDARGRG